MHGYTREGYHTGEAMTYEFEIQGMTCQHCVAAVRAALQALPGVQVLEVNVGSARVEYDAAAASPEQMRAAIRDEGYQVS